MAPSANQDEHNEEVQEQQRQQQPASVVTTGALSDSDDGLWTVLQEEQGMTVYNFRFPSVQGRPAWRRLMGSWGDWHLLKAQAVRGLPGVVRSCAAVSKTS